MPPAEHEVYRPGPSYRRSVLQRTAALEITCLNSELVGQRFLCVVGIQQLAWTQEDGILLALFSWNIFALGGRMHSPKRGQLGSKILD